MLGLRDKTCVFLCFHVVLRDGVREQRHGRVAVVVVGGYLVGVVDRVGWAGVATATAAAEYPGNRPEYGSVEAAAGALADEAVERRVSHAVQGGEQQRQVIVVKDGWKINTWRLRWTRVRL